LAAAPGGAYASFIVSGDARIALDASDDDFGTRARHAVSRGRAISFRAPEAAAALVREDPEIDASDPRFAQPATEWTFPSFEAWREHELG
jgi:hypothetical protein